jgi:hypothetical protein
MFGVINAPNAVGSPSSAAAMWQGMMDNSSSLAAMDSYTRKLTASNTKAAKWGATLDLAAVPQWAQPHMAENIM